MDNKVEDKSNPKPEDVNHKKEFDLTVYNRVKHNFENLLIIYENYKSGKYDVLEKVARTARSLDVM